MSDAESPLSVAPRPASRGYAGPDGGKTSDNGNGNVAPPRDDDATESESSAAAEDIAAGAVAAEAVAAEGVAESAAAQPVTVRSRLDGESLRSRTIRGSLWTTGGYGAGLVVRLGTNLVLTRLLQPHMFGVMTLVNIFVQGLQSFSDLGLGPAIIQNKRGDERPFLNTAWTMQVLRGTALGTVSALIAWPVARLYGEDQLMWLLPVAGLTAVIAGFNSTAQHTLNRHLDVGKLTLRALVGQVTGAAVMIGWALLHPSVWALVAGNIAAAVANLIFSHSLIPGVKNRFQWDRSAATELMRFGRWIFVSTVLTFLGLQADRLIFGKLIPMHELGIYGVAAMMATLPTSAILKLGTSVAFPAYSRAKAAGSNFQRVFDQVRLPLLAFGGFTAACMIACGRPVIELLYDYRYHDAGWMLQLLAVSAWFQVLQVTNGSALLALGSPKSIAAANVTKLSSMVLCVPLGFWAYGLSGAIAGIIVSDILKYAVSAIAARRKGLRMLGKDLSLSMLVALSAAAALAVDYFFLDYGIGPTSGLNPDVPRTDSHHVGAALAIVAAVVVTGGIWAPVIVRSLRSRKVVA
jgi:O-antigen/teichoic acid export membrane protein